MLLSPRTLTRHNCKAVDRSTVSSIWDYERDALRVCVCVCAWLIDALVEAVSEGVDTFTPTTSKTQRQDKVRPLPAKEKKNKNEAHISQALLESAQDVQRTHCGLSFFSQPIPSSENALSGSPVARRCFSRLHMLRPAPSLRRPVPVNRSSMTTQFSSPSTTNTNNESRSSSPANNPSTGLSSPSVESEPDSRADQLHRLLFCWALCHPAGYVQGMSSLASVFLFVFATRDTEDQRRHAEADAFHAFSHLLGQSGLGELFSVAEDGFEMSRSGNGLGAVLARLGERVELCDAQLSAHLKQEGVQPSFFAIKWLVGDSPFPSFPKILVADEAMGRPHSSHSSSTCPPSSPFGTGSLRSCMPSRP